MVVKIIAINGPPMVGKDTLANELVKQLGRCSKIVQFKDGLFSSVNLPYIFNTWESYDSLKEKYPHEVRQVLIRFSENIIKPLFGEDYWAIDLVKRVYAMDSTINTIVIPDLGFQVELDTLSKFFGDDLITVQLRREGKDFSADSRNYVPSELIFSDLLLSDVESAAKTIIRHMNNKQ